MTFTNFFGGAFFGGGFFGEGVDDVKTGTGGIDPGESGVTEPRAYKPTGILHRPRKEGRKDVADRVDESAKISADIAAKLAREFGEENDAAKELPVAIMSSAEIDFEIGLLIRKQMRTEEDELMLLVLMMAASA